MKKVFIGGCPRSGTTMLGDLLGSCEGAIVTPESQFNLDAIRKFGLTKDSLVDEEVAGFILNHWRLKVWGLNEIDLKVCVKKHIGHRYEHLIVAIVELYSKEKHGIDSPSVWIDHTPSNLHSFAQLTCLFSGTYCINILRDCRAVYGSLKKVPWGPKDPISHSNMWLRHVATGLSYTDGKLSGHVLHVRYEDVVNRDRRMLSAIEEFLGEMLDLNGLQNFSVPQYTQLQHSLVGKSFQVNRINAWKNELSRREVQILESYCGIVMENLGYGLSERSCAPAILFPRWLERMMVISRGKLKMFYFLITRNWYRKYRI